MNNQQNTYSLTEAEVKKISREHIRHVDKWYRMCAGCASDLTRYENGIIYLTIKTNESKIPANFERALQFAKDWVNFNKELSGAKGFVAAFYKTKFTGFMIGAGAINKEGLENVCQQFKDAKEGNPELINIFSGLFI